jgi:hypothetical protein
VDSVQIETGLREVFEFLTEERVSLLVVLLSVSGDHDECAESCLVSLAFRLYGALAGGSHETMGSGWEQSRWYLRLEPITGPVRDEPL